VYQYKVVPYGFKSSLSAFIRALDMALGDGLEENVVTYVHDVVVTYVHDVVVHSVCFEDHLHLDAVLGKLTTAGFKINANKRGFCKLQIKWRMLRNTCRWLEVSERCLPTRRVREHPHNITSLSSIQSSVSPHSSPSSLCAPLHATIQMTVT